MWFGKWAAGQPFTGVKGLFGGRCSVESDYVITMAFYGEATHAGRVTGGGSHCTQLIWTPQGPGGVTYSDGQGSLVSANGSVLNVRWGNGTSGVDPATGVMWFKDDFRFDGGSGRFTGATGGGQGAVPSRTSWRCSRELQCPCGWPGRSPTPRRRAEPPAGRGPSPQSR